MRRRDKDRFPEFLQHRLERLCSQQISHVNRPNRHQPCWFLLSDLTAYRLANR